LACNSSFSPTSGRPSRIASSELSQQIRYFLDQPCQPLSRHGRNGEGLTTELALQPLTDFFAAGEFGFTDYHDFWFFGQGSTVQFKLAMNDPVIVHRIAVVGRKRFDEVDEDPSPFHMPQELMAQTHPAMGAFD
jgi:hypothetical protein